MINKSDAAPGQASSVDIDDAGDIGAASPVNTASEPSAVKETVKPESVKPATPRKNDEENEKARARNINTNVNNAFTARPDNSTGNNTGAQSSQESGNSSSPSKGVTPGAKIGNGWSISSYGDVGAKGKPLGSVIIEVEVDSQGKVISATPAGGTPPAASNPAVIAECMKAARQSKFRRSLHAGLAAGHQAHSLAYTWHYNLDIQIAGSKPSVFSSIWLSVFPLFLGGWWQVFADFRQIHKYFY